MRQDRNSGPETSGDSLNVEVGRWFRANATGRGVIAIPVVVVVLAVVAVIRIHLG